MGGDPLSSNARIVNVVRLVRLFPARERGQELAKQIIVWLLGLPVLPMSPLSLVAALCFRHLLLNQLSPRVVPPQVWRRLCRRTLLPHLDELLVPPGTGPVVVAPRRTSRLSGAYTTKQCVLSAICTPDRTSDSGPDVGRSAVANVCNSGIARSASRLVRRVVS